MLKTIQEKLGPGLMFAASAVGVSHLVQSTRGGARYGLTILAIIVFICLLKYPMFLFSARYTATSGETLLDGYGRLGKWILAIVFVVHLLELPFAMAGVSIVTSGIIKSVTGLDLNDVVLSILLIFASVTLLAIGRYPLLENISKVFVIIFFFCIVLAAGMSIDGQAHQHIDFLPSLDFNEETILFLVAIAGWMPTGVAGALGISLWVYAKGQELGHTLNVKDAIFDFNLGYGAVIFTACCFAILGSYVFYSNNVSLEEGSADFFAQLSGMFVTTLGQWAYYVFSLGSVIVMFSSLLVLVDLLPRISSEAIIRLMPRKFEEANQKKLYSYFIAYEILAVLAVFLILFDSFSAFINLVTSIGFLAAPIIAYLNYKLIFSSQVPPHKQPSTLLRLWGISTIVGLMMAAILYLYLKIS